MSEGEREQLPRKSISSLPALESEKFVEACDYDDGVGDDVVVGLTRSV